MNKFGWVTLSVIWPLASCALPDPEMAKMSREYMNLKASTDWITTSQWSTWRSAQYEISCMVINRGTTEYRLPKHAYGYDPGEYRAHHQWEDYHSVDACCKMQTPENPPSQNVLQRMSRGFGRLLKSPWRGNFKHDDKLIEMQKRSRCDFTLTVDTVKYQSEVADRTIHVTRWDHIGIPNRKVTYGRLEQSGNGKIAIYWGRTSSPWVFKGFWRPNTLQNYELQPSYQRSIIWQCFSSMQRGEVRGMEECIDWRSDVYFNGAQRPFKKAPEICGAHRGDPTIAKNELKRRFDEHLLIRSAAFMQAKNLYDHYGSGADLSNIHDERVREEYSEWVKALARRARR